LGDAVLHPPQLGIKDVVRVVKDVEYLDDVVSAIQQRTGSK
jgi:hypothetical protein